tara:strand:+ start:956 stop:1105 length:150 start_codon:yes stop_codon:yes gene_type:complete
MSALNMFKKNFAINYLEDESEHPFKKQKKQMEQIKEEEFDDNVKYLNKD